MRILAIHAEHFSYETTSPAIDEPEPLQKDLKKSFENVLVLFTSIEESDDGEVVDDAVSEIHKIIEQVKPSEVLIYPYAHLSQNLAPPSKAVEILNEFYTKASRNFKTPVYKAPFGWYKSFKLACYGHPLSELSRTVAKRGALQQKTAIHKRYYVMACDGSLHKPEEFDYSQYPELKILVDKEVYGIEFEGGENRVNYYCQKFGFEWEPLSDHGHMRYNPLAATMIDAVSKYSWQVVKDLGIPVFRVMGTNMFSLKERPVYEHALLFGDRLYEIEVDNEKYVLRYAACHQQFAMLKDWVISYRDLPFGVFEIADSYRLEQRGEVSLCFRLRKFYMPDLHILTKDLEEALEIAKKVQCKIHEEAKKIGRKYVALYNVTEDFLANHLKELREFVENEGSPVLLAVLPPGIYYWVINVEYHIIDNLKRPREIATFQIDVGNSMRFGIIYVDESNNRKHPVIIHTAIIGSLERYLYMVFDTAALMETEGKVPYIPTWLVPTQVRIIPVSREFLGYAERALEEISKHHFRADLDDRDLSLGKKIRDAATSWIPYIVVIGRREIETQTVNVKIRKSNEQKVMKLEELIELLKEEVKGYPQTDMTMPVKLSSRPIF